MNEPADPGEAADPEEHAGPGGAADREDDGADDGELVSRLRVIEDQPLQARADAYGQIFEELRRTLDEGNPTARG